MRGTAQRPEVEPGDALRQYYSKLLEGLGEQGWWPARTRLEVILGAILTQNTSWRNAARALTKLREQKLLNLTSLAAASRAKLESAVRPAGFFRQKARTIRNILAWLEKTCRGSLDAMFAIPAARLREELLRISGIGPETADAILLYAGRKPFFVADAYTRRILSRHGLVPETAGYAEVQEYLHRHLVHDEAMFNEFHALLVEVGKTHCKRQSPRCESCLLKEFLPAPEGAAERSANLIFEAV